MAKQKNADLTPMQVGMQETQKQIQDNSAVVAQKTGLDPSLISKLFWTQRRLSSVKEVPTAESVIAVIEALTAEGLSVDSFVNLRSSNRNFQSPTRSTSRVSVSDFTKPSSAVKEYRGLLEHASIYARIPDAVGGLKEGDRARRDREAKYAAEDVELGGVLQRTRVRTAPMQGLTIGEKKRIQEVSIKDLIPGATHIHPSARGTGKTRPAKSKKVEVVAKKEPVEVKVTPEAPAV